MPVLFRENDRLSVRQRQRRLQEVQNYSSSQEKEKKKKKGAKGEKGRADGVSVGKEGGIARRETEQKDKPER